MSRWILLGLTAVALHQSINTAEAHERERGRWNKHVAVRPQPVHLVSPHVPIRNPGLMNPGPIGVRVPSTGARTVWRYSYTFGPDGRLRLQPTLYRVIGGTSVRIYP